MPLSRTTGLVAGTATWMLPLIVILIHPVVVAMAGGITDLALLANERGKLYVIELLADIDNEGTGKPPEDIGAAEPANVRADELDDNVGPATNEVLVVRLDVEIKSWEL